MAGEVSSLFEYASSKIELTYQMCQHKCEGREPGYQTPEHGEPPKPLPGLVLSYYHRVRDVLPFAEYDHSIGFPGYPRYLGFTSFD